MANKDEYGRLIIDSDSLFELLYSGKITEFPECSSSDSKIISYNELVTDLDHPEMLIPYLSTISETPLEHHQTRQGEWFVPTSYKSLDVLSELLKRCKNDLEMERVELEYNLFFDFNLIPVLQFLFYLVDHFKENNVIWGVGRGSSVSSFILYLIGVHKVDSLKYNLDISEFLR